MGEILMFETGNGQGKSKISLSLYKNRPLLHVSFVFPM